MNESVINSDFDGSNSHERALGIRWLLWLLAFMAFLNFLPSSKDFWIDGDKVTAYFFFWFGVISLWLSLPPDWPVQGWGASLWLHRLIPQIRVPNRAGIGVGFSVIVLSGLYLKNYFFKTNLKSQLAISILYVLFVVIELPPLLQPMPIARIYPPLDQLTQSRKCGWGIQYPYVSSQEKSIEYYYLLQKMRGSQCGIINSSVPTNEDSAMIKIFSEKMIKHNFESGFDTEIKKLKIFVHCVPLSWVVLDGALSQKQKKDVCLELGWNWDKNNSCVSNNLNTKVINSLSYCAKKVMN